MDDRNQPFGQRDPYGRDRDYGEDYGAGRDYTYSSARDYAAAGELGGRRERGNYGYGYRPDEHPERARYGAGAGSERGGWDRERGQYRGQYQGQYRAEPQRGFGGRDPDGRERDRGGYDSERGFIDRAGDEIRSWFGDEEAERRRELDQRQDARQARDGWRDGGARDDHYHAWRSERISELDRDYDEYRRENAQRFQNEFGSWRTERQGQRDSLSRVAEHMEVVGSDDTHVGTVDKVRGDRIILTKSDSNAGDHHHSIPSRWIQSVDDKVTLRKTAEEAKAHWRDEERAGALFGQGRTEDETSWRSDRNLERSFRGTY